MKNKLGCDDCSDELIGETLIKRANAAGATARCNDNISAFINEGETELMKAQAIPIFEKFLTALGIDYENDHNTRETARRYVNAMADEYCGGRLKAKPKITLFENLNAAYNQVIISGPISIRGMCGHHLAPIIGKAYIGVYPGKKVIGLSKFHRLVDWIASRPSIQEEMTVQISNAIQEETEADGVAVIVRCEHMCVTHRGVKEHESDMTTSMMTGVFLTNPDIKREFISLIAQMR